MIWLAIINKDWIVNSIGFSIDRGSKAFFCNIVFAENFLLKLSKAI